MVIRQVMAACAAASIVAAQDTVGARRIVSSSPSPVATASLPPLARVISIRLRDVPLSSALDTIAARGGVELSYSPDAIRGHPRVGVDLREVTVRRALETVLHGTGLELFVSDEGHAAIERRPAMTPAMIRGLVFDATSHAPVAQAQVHLEGTRRTVTTGSDGRYVIATVPAGTYQLTARRLGYESLTRTVQLDTATADVDFGLTPVPTKLDQVVTTALGDQRRYQIGNDIGSINVDSLVPTTPVTSLTDVISARVPGVEVLESSGQAGDGHAIRIRGNGSMVVQGDPIIVVDGVRQDNAPGGAYAPLFAASRFLGAVPAPSRLNDIDFRDIESIDVLKGPSAATEYGTDAANGVIVIKTKHARPGSARWTLSGEQGISEVGASFPNTYYAYGHTAGASPMATQCPLVADPIGAGVGSLAGTCVVDSLVNFSALTNPNTTIYTLGNRQKYDLSVAGGTDAVRYYVAGGLSNETGVLGMPTAFDHLADSLGLPKSAWRPNTNDQRSARANTVIELAPTAELQVNASYLATAQQAPEFPSEAVGAYLFPPVDNAANNFGYGPFLGIAPVAEFGQLAGQSTNRLTGSLTGHWTPTGWLTASLTAGVDHGSQRSTAETLPEVAPLVFAPAALAITNGTTDIYTFDGRASATARLAPILRATTSVGLQMVDTRMQGTYAVSQSITTTNQSLNGAANALISQTGIRQATLGGYTEEQLSFWDRLFVTGAVRIDAGSDFGSGYAAAVYPKASVSWLGLTGGATTVRLRAAVGASGVQPPSGAALELYGEQLAYLNGALGPTNAIVNVVNPHLEPERSVEAEGGADLGFWHDRVDIGLTAYAKTTTNALVAVGGWETGSINSYENLGEVSNNGFEANVTAALLRSRMVTWDVALNASTNHNDLVKLAPGVQPQLIGESALMRFAPGTPLYGYAAPKEHFTAQYHGGPVSLNDVSVEDSLSYVGPSQPTRTVSFSTHTGLWYGLVTVGALFDYRGGFRLANSTVFSAANVQSDQGSVDPHAPIWEQERDVAWIVGSTAGGGSYIPSGFYEDASYVRFRELSVTLALPDRFAHAAHVRTLSLTGAIRNVALWTAFTGGDPEVTSSSGANTTFEPTTNSYMVNHDIRESAEPVPLSRYFLLRLNAGF